MYLRIDPHIGSIGKKIHLYFELIIINTQWLFHLIPHKLEI